MDIQLMHETLVGCSKQFMHYANNHREKARKYRAEGKPYLAMEADIKAEVNEGWVRKCEFSIQT